MNISPDSEKSTRYVDIASLLAIQPKESQLSSTVTTDVQRISDATLWRNLSHILQQRDLKTTYTWYPSYDVYQETIDVQRISDATLWRNLSHILQQRDLTQETVQDSQKRKVSERFAVLAQRENNWDGYGSKKPTELTLSHAENLIEELFDTIISAEHPWIPPFISSDEDGYVTVEWYEEERELHLLVGENEAEYLRVWGTNIDTNMDEGFLNRDNYLALWEWLFHV